MRVALRVLLAILILTPVVLLGDTTAQTLPFSQNWANTGLITVNDDWSGVPGITGFRGDGLTGATGADPQTLTAADAAPVIDVNANQTAPNTFGTGGVTEFHIADSVVALTGSGTADAPYLQIYLNTTGFTAISVSYNVRDIDGSIDNAIQPLALHYRVGGSGTFTNLPAGYIADASSGPSLATLVTPISVVLPAGCDNQALVELRIMTTNAAGNDEWLGIDDIAITGTAVSVTPALSINDVTLVEGDAGTTTYTFSVSLSMPADAGGVTFDIATADNTATTADNDYVANSLTGQTIPAGSSSYTFDVVVNGDTAIETNETFFVNVTNVTGADVTDGQGQGTIQNDDSPPDLTIADVAIPEGDTGVTPTLNVTVQLSAPARAGGVTFDIATSDGTATAGVDYVAASAIAVSIPEGDSSYTFAVTITGDAFDEDDETFFIDVTSPPTGATLVDGHAVATITDDDAAPTLSIVDIALTEGNLGTQTATFTVQLSTASGRTVTVDYTTADSSATTADADYVTAAGTLTFVPGDTSESFDVVVNGDTNSEGNEQFFVNLSAPVNATLPDPEALGVILLDDPFSLAAVDTFYPENFDVLSQTSGAVTTPVGWTMLESGSNANLLYSAGTGSSGTGDTYSFGAAGSSERAFGAVLSGTLTPSTGAWYRNDTGVTITNLFVGYTGEQWRLGASGRTDRLDFQFSFNATSLGTGTWIDVDSLDFLTPNTTGSAGLRNGNLATYRTTLGYTITGLSIAPGATFWLRWSDFNAAGSDDGLAVDDFLIAANSTASTLSIDDVAITEGNAGTSIMTFTVSLSAPRATDITFDITTLDGTGATGATAADNDYVANTLNDVIIPAGNTTYSFDVTVNGDVLVEPTENFTVAISDAVGAIITDSQGIGTIYFDDYTATPIHDVQGSGTASPVNGTTVTIVGIVTGIKSGGGFFVQEPDGTADADPNTSEGIYVYTGGAIPAGVAIGNRVAVTGTVSEYPPAPPLPAIPPHTATELVAPLSVSLLATGQPLPGAATITAADGAPTTNFSQYERFEGMRVAATLTAVTGTDGSVDEPNANGSSNGVFYAVIQGVARPFREIGMEQSQTVPSDAPCALCIPRFDENPEKLRVDSDNQPGALQLNVVAGQTISNVVGVLDFGFNEYTILPEAATVPVVTGASTFTAVPGAAPTEVTIGSFNIERFFDTVDDPNDDVALTAVAVDKRLNKASAAIIDVLGTPDVLGIVEVENLTIAQALAARIDALTAGATNYVAYLEEGNDIGGIDVGFLVNENRVTVNSVTQFGKTATYVNPDTGADLMLNDRPPLLLEASIVRPDLTLFDFTVIVNHLRSLNGIDTDDAGGRRVRAKRAAQAEYLANLVQSRQSADPTERIVLVGDFNAFEVSDGYVDVIGTILGTPAPANEVVKATSDLVDPNLTNLLGTLPSTQQYSYLYDGNAQAIDHGIVNAAMLPSFTRMAYGRLDADFPEIFRTDGSRPERISDHDGLVAYFDVGSTNDAPVNTVPGAQAALEDTALVFSAGNGNAISITDPDAAALDVEVTLTVTDGSLTLASLVGLTFSVGDGASDTMMVFRGSIANVNTALEGLSFVPTPEFSGPVVLTITTNDLGHSGDGGALFDTDTVAIDVAAINDAPSIVIPAAQTTPEGVDLAIPGISITDIDAGAGTLQLSLTSTIGTLSATAVPGVTMIGTGTATLTLQGTLGAVNTALAGLVFTPPTNLGGIGSITIVANDSGFTGAGGPMTATASIAVTVTDVNDGPTLTVPGPLTTAETTPVALPGIVVGDVDSAANSINLTLTSTIGTFTLGGSAGVIVTGSGTGNLTMTGAVSDLAAAIATLIFTPPSTGGSGTITVTINDGGFTGGAPLSATNTIAVTVTDVNNAPIVTTPGAQTTNEDTVLVFSTGNGNRISVSDADSGTANVQVAISVTNGTGTLASTAGLIVTGNGTGAITISGPVAAIDAALEALQFSAPVDYSGPASITVTIDDLGNTGTGGPLAAIGMVAIDVVAVNDAPAVTGVPLTGTEDSLVVLSGIVIADVDASVIQATITTSLGVPLALMTPGAVISVVGSGTPTLVVTGSPSAVNMALTSVQFTPPADFSGAATVNVTVSDLGNSGSGGVLTSSTAIPLTIASANDAPGVTVPGAQTTPEETNLSFSTATANAISVSDADAGATPIQVTLTTTIGTLTAGPFAGVTIIGSGTAVITATGSVVDLNAALQTLVLVVPGAMGGTGTLSVTVNDLGATGTGGPQTATANVAITIADENDAPALVLPGAQTTNEGIDLVFSTLNGNAISISDTDAGTGDVQLTFTTSLGTMTLGSTAGLTTVVGNGTAAITITGPIAAINAALQNLTLTVPSGMGGAGTISLAVSDLGNTGSGGALTANGTISVTVNDVNDPPTLTVPGAQTTPEGTNLVFATANGNAISVTDIDAAGGNIRVTLTTTFGTLSLGSTAGLIVTGNGTAAITAEGPVSSLNAALQGLTLTVSTTGEQTGTISIGVNDLGLTGSGGAQSAAAAVAVTVSGVNDAPTVAVPAAQTTAEGVDLVFIAANGNSITVDDIDAGTGAIQVTVSTTTGTLSLGGIAGLTVAGNGTTTVTATGTITDLNAGLQGLTLTNALDTSGAATITVVVSDLGLTGTGGVLTATGSIAVTITDVNDAPTIAAPPSQTTPEDVNLVFAAANGNAISIADVDAGTGGIQLSLTTTIGTLSLGSTAGLVVVGDGTAAITASGTLVAINAALEGMTLVVPAATNGTGTLSVGIDDLGNTGTGGALTATANVAITIDSINNPPVITIASLTQDGTSGFVIFSAGRGNGITISDPDADTSPIEITLTATCGTITLGSTTGLTFTAGDGTSDSTMTFTGTITSINAAFEGMMFTVEPGCTGNATLVVSVNDLGATGTNGAQIATATINISAAAVAAVPTLSFFGLLALGLALLAAAGFRLK